MNNTIKHFKEDFMSKKIIFIILGVIGVIVLAGAAFMAMRLFNTSQANGVSGGMKMQIQSSGAGGGGKTAYSVDIEPAPELPKQESQASGIIATLKDNNFTVQGGGKVLVSKSSDGTTNIQSDGPSTEVIVTKNTKIYHDTTFDGHPPVNGEKVKQVIEPYTEGQIEKNDMARVWGSKNGDRLIADFILITRPVMLNSSGGN
jgi:hypothetical protein